MPTLRNWLSQAICWHQPAPACPVPIIGRKAVRSLCPAAGFPRGLEWKAKILSELNSRLLDRAKFVNFALRSVEDGLLIADPEGRITFANRSAGAILGVPARGLVGQNLTQRLSGWVDAETLARLSAERGHFEREIAIRGLHTLQYTLRLAAVSADENGVGPVLGIVASLSDVTRQYELQQTKNDVISLVSHEMRTPLTAIQGMTELLAAYDVEPVQRREMNLAINDEVKRLTRVHAGSLDLTPLERGASPMRLSRVRADSFGAHPHPRGARVGAPRQLRGGGNSPPTRRPSFAKATRFPGPVGNRVWTPLRSGPTGPMVSVSDRAGGG